MTNCEQFAGTPCGFTKFPDAGPVLSKASLALGGIEAFKSVERVVIQSIAYYDEDGEPLGENFLVRVAQHGVRHIEFKGDEEETRSTSIAAALSFGFSEPTYRGDRSLLGVACDGTDFLAQVKQVCRSIVVRVSFCSVPLLLFLVCSVEQNLKKCACSAPSTFSDTLRSSGINLNFHLRMA